MSGGWSKTRGSFGCMCLFASLFLAVKVKILGELQIPQMATLQATLVESLVSSQSLCSGAKRAPDITCWVILPLASYLSSVFQASSAREDMKEQELAG